VCDHRTLPRRAARAIRRCEALGQRNVTLPGWSVLPRGRPTTTSAKVVGGQRGWQGYSGERLKNVVTAGEPKVLRGLDQQVRSQMQGYLPSPAVTMTATGGEAKPRCVRKMRCWLLADSRRSEVHHFRSYGTLTSRVPISERSA